MERTWVWAGIVLIVILFAGGTFIFSGFDNAGDPSKVSQSTNSGGVIDYGNGVYYFSFSEAAYGKALSEFMGEHPDLKLVSQAGDGTGFHGNDRGYFVVFEPRVQKE